MEALNNVIPLISKKLDSAHPSIQISFDCDICGDVGMEIVPGYGARICICRERKMRTQRLSKIPPKFAKAELMTLKPNAAIHPKQAETIRIMQANPDNSFFLSGRFGCGKSLMMWALYKYAVDQGDRRVVVCTLAELLNEYRAFIQASINHETPKFPRLCAEELRQSDIKYAIFLDDVDKARPTEYAAEQFFEIVNAIYDFQHQVVVTTNLTGDSLKTHFDRADERFGGAIVRRLIDGAKFVQMF